MRFFGILGDPEELSQGNAFCSGEKMVAALPPRIGSSRRKAPNCSCCTGRPDPRANLTSLGSQAPRSMLMPSTLKWVMPTPTGLSGTKLP